MSESGSRKRKQRVLQWRLSGCLARARALKKGKAARRTGWVVVERVPKHPRRCFLPLYHRYRDICGLIQEPINSSMSLL